MGDGKHRPRQDVADLEGLAKRFQDLWQEQLAATAADPEFMEMMGKWMGAIAAAGMGPPSAPAGPAVGVVGPPDPAVWMAAMQQALAAAGKGGPGDVRVDGGSPAARAKAAAAASGAGNVDGDQFERRLADLEERVGRLEAHLGGARKGTSAGTRRRKS